MACPCEFEAKIQVECVMDVIEMLRGGDLVAKRAELLQHVGCVVGSLGAWMGARDGLFGKSENELPGDIESCCRAIEEEVKADSGDSVYGINPMLVILIQQLIKLILKNIL